jgi:hypothetical protein
MPKHPNKTITILYKSNFIDLKILYNIWRTDDKSFNPSEWPFPTKIKESDSSSKYRPSKYIVIDHSALKQCWPNCVILMSVITDTQSLTGAFSSFASGGVFGIMASNNQL